MKNKNGKGGLPGFIKEKWSRDMSGRTNDSHCESQCEIEWRVRGDTPSPYPFSHHPLRSTCYKTLSMWSRALLSVLVRFQDDRREEKRGFRRSDQFLNVHDDGTLNEAVNEERMQLERTEVEDERVKRDPLMELMEMKRKQREQRKRYHEKHPEISREQRRRYRKNTLSSYVSKTGGKGKRIGRK